MPKIASIALLFLLLLPSSALAAGGPAAIGGMSADKSFSYSALIDAIERKQVKEAVISTERSLAQIRFKNKKDSVVVGIPEQNEQLIRQLDSSGAVVRVQRNIDTSSGFMWLPIAILLLAGSVIAAMAIFSARKRSKLTESNKGGIGRKKSQQLKKFERPTVSFKDVAGCDEAIAEVSEFLAFLKDPLPFKKVGASMPRGIILHGPPGTGKTLLAKALSGESGCAFFAVSGSEFVERYVGVGASRVRELFQDARAQEEGAVIFIDEIDAIGKSRGSGGFAGANDEREQTLNQLLVEMDGFKNDERVVVVAATNRLDTLDTALLRPGRLSRHVYIGLPALKGRKQILEVHAKGKPLADDVNLEDLAEYTAGSSGADLANMLNEAAIMTARDNRDEISDSDLREGHLRAIAGPEKQDSAMLEEERQVVAYHEAGHVLTAELCPEHDKAQRATIKPRGQAGGLAVYGQKDRALQSADFIHQRLIVALGGRAAEAVVFGHVTSGAANDLQMANHIARQAVEELGFSPEAGQLVRVSHERFADSTKHVLDSEVERLVAEAYNDALDLLAAERPALDRLAEKLLEAEDIDRLEISAALAGSQVARPRGPQKLQPQRRVETIEEGEEFEERSRSKQLVSAIRAFLPARKRRLADAE